MILKTTSEVPSPTNIRKSREPGNGEMNDNNEVGSKEIEENLSKVNPSGTHFFIFKARVVFIC